MVSLAHANQLPLPRRDCKVLLVLSLLYSCKQRYSNTRTFTFIIIIIVSSSACLPSSFQQGVGAEYSDTQNVPRWTVTRWVCHVHEVASNPWWLVDAHWQKSGLILTSVRSSDMTKQSRSPQLDHVSHLSLSSSVSDAKRTQNFW